MPIPPELRWLYEHGRLLAEEARALGDKPMSCILCGADLDLIYNHGPQVITPGKTLPGTVHGKDMTVLCRCCSRAGCTHRQKGSAAA